MVWNLEPICWKVPHTDIVIYKCDNDKYIAKASKPWPQSDLYLYFNNEDYFWGVEDIVDNSPFLFDSLKSCYYTAIET